MWTEKNVWPSVALGVPPLPFKKLIVGSMDAVCDKRKYAVITNKNTASLKLQKNNVCSGG